MTLAKLSSGHAHRFVRYLLVGGLNTAFGFAIYSALIVAGISLWLALLSANVAGVLFNFFTTGTLVFRTSLRGRLLRFMAAYGCIYGCNLLLLALLRHWWPSEILSQALLTLPMAVFAYLLLNRFVFVERM